ncbi:hypothetical protein PLESTB_001768500 [Pleodorina starrii]|uniref:Uncharacterized protein n=1 Tax=Pleodorina starrii TaxID=330485 RepID=A0A9W6C0K9_9CHLO|nr:hypothetical protein PLESTM_001863800 [Pleodorina starrii]GLC61548.1 hypothetical protein PLESTB_001768500 [Pleodorina starrii]GLC76827.1 hypothetical protein PLESTF_001845400 [Pleodorina starrii]
MPQPVPLAQRAVHPFFLRKLAQEKVPGGTGCIGDLTTAQVVQAFIRPATLQAKRSFTECLLWGQLTPKYVQSWCTTGVTKTADGEDQKMFGPARFFASHAWIYKFGVLVSMLDNHYGQLPGTKGGQRFIPVYYWVDILAVTQHFTGDIKDHPDYDFAGVIKQCKAVLFTMHPWRSPIAPTRVWCLFEALTAIQAPGVEFEVVVDVKDSKDTRVQTVQIISNSIEVRTAQATVSADKAFIIECIEQGIGINAFNNTIRKRLKEALLQAVTPNAVEMGDTSALHELLKIGGCVRPDGISDLPSYFKFASETDMLNILRTINIRDLRPRGLALSGRCRSKEVALADAGLRGWDGQSCSLREYNESETGRMMWNYLPASPALCHAVAELLVMPAPGSPSSASSGGGSVTASNRGVEELWISLRPPRPEDWARQDPESPSAGGGGGPSAPGTPGTPGGGGSAGSSGGGAAPLSCSRPSSAVPASATAARAAARAVTSPQRRRLASALNNMNALLSSVSAGRSASGTRLSFASGHSYTAGVGSGVLLPPTSPNGIAAAPPPAAAPSPRSGSLGGMFFPGRRSSVGAPASPSFARGGSGSGSGGGSHSLSHGELVDCSLLSGSVLASPRLPGENREVALPPGRPALWTAVGASRTLKMLCLHQAVLGPQDLQMLSTALSATRTLEALQVVKCIAPGPEACSSGATAKLNAELFALGLGCGNLRHLHVRPGELLHIESFPAAVLGRAGSSFLLRRVTLAPVALGPPAIRQLGKALAPQPYLHSLIVGMDPAPPATWMPKEQTEWDQWLAHEDKNEPEMAEKRRRHLGLTDDDQAAYMAHCWDFKEDLPALPDPDRGYSAVQQRAAAISFFCTLSAGWRDPAAYTRQYAKWAWARRTKAEEQLAHLQNSTSFETYRALAFEMLRAAPESYSSKFDPNEQKKRSAKSRLQKAFWETFI